MRCSVYIATSLDGFIARDDGGIDWLGAVQKEGEDYGYAAFFASVDALILGRGTYDTALSFDPWPYEGKRCIVLTHRPPATAVANEEFFTGTAAQLHARLAAEGTKHAYVDGGDVIRQFVAAGLVDELTVSLVPILLGEGRRLFGPTGRDVPLELASATPYDTGLVKLTYRSARSHQLAAISQASVGS